MKNLLTLTVAAIAFAAFATVSFANCGDCEKECPSKDKAKSEQTQPGESS